MSLRSPHSSSNGSSANGGGSARSSVNSNSQQSGVQNGSQNGSHVSTNSGSHQPTSRDGNRTRSSVANGSHKDGSHKDSSHQDGSHKDGSRASVNGGSHARSPVAMAYEESECTSGTELSSKLRPGAAVEVLSKTADSWVAGQVVSPEHDGKVTVEFELSGAIHHKSIRTESQEVRLPQQPCEERSIASESARRSRSSSVVRDPSLTEAKKQLVELKAIEQELISVSDVKERTTAAAKWARARRIAESCSSFQLWGSGNEQLHGAYIYVPTAQQGPPTFQHATRPQKWLFVSTTGSWWIGDSECKDNRQPKGWMRSAAAPPGTLPSSVDTWEAPKSGEWEPQESARFWMSESVDVAWQQVRVAAFETPVLEIRGVSDSFVDGLYDFISGDGEPGAAPAYQHQQRPNLWLFVARDQRWWIGNSTAKEAMDDRGLLHSAPVQPGTHPKEARGWHIRNSKVWEECRGLNIRISPSATRASEKWAQALSKADHVQIWGKEYYHGEYLLKEDMEGVPAYQYTADPDIWLYLAMDGCWWLADTENKDARRARGYLRSDVVEPGTLPQNVDCWKDLKINSWEANLMVCVRLREAVEEEWQVASDLAAQRESEGEVIEIQGVVGPSFNGFYDLVHPPAGKRDTRRPPTFQNQINQGLFLYVATDGRWWLSDEKCMRGREPSGRMHSDLIRPGMLPVSGGLSWHVFNRTSKEWERQEDIVIS